MIENIAACVEALEERILALEAQPTPDAVQDVLASLGLTHMQLSSAQVVALLDMLADGITPVNKDIITALLYVTDAQRKFFYSLAGLLEAGAAAIAKRREEEALASPEPESEPETEGDEAPEPDAGPEAVLPAAAAAPEDADKAEPGHPAKHQAITSIRVDTDRLDRLIELVGKLTVTYAVIAQAGGENASKVTSSLRELDLVINKLQSEMDAIRLVPLKQIFTPMHRLVSSLSQKIGKKLRFEVSGDDLPLDKSIVECLNEPLVHLLRNAVDHGLEDTEGRKGAGKDETGLVRLSAWRQGEMAYIEVADDGKGMDPARIRAKAEERGLVEPGREYSDQEVLQFILRSGFSTAEKVTDVSGRGVGMDAVINVIRNTLDGDLTIQSELGKGSAFTLSIPLSRSANEGIVEALICRIGPDTFIIPSQDVVEIYVPRQRDLVDLPDGRRTVDVRGEVHLLLSLADHLGLTMAATDITRAQTVVVRVGDIKAAILVDEVMRQQQVVITKFTVPVQDIFELPILGYGMMGESDALVVNTESLLLNMDKMPGVGQGGTSGGTSGGMDKPSVSA